MTYIAHTKEQVPVLKGKATMNLHPSSWYENNNVGRQQKRADTEKYNQHIKSLKSIPIHPDNIYYWSNLEEVDGNDFEIIEAFAIPKTKIYQESYFKTI